MTIVSRSGLRGVRTAVAVALVAALGLVLVGCGSATPSGGTVVSPSGDTRIVYDPPATRVPARDVAGQSLTEPLGPLGVDDFPGQVVVLNVWGSWCGPCRGEADDLERVATQTTPLGVAFLGINVRDSRAAARDFTRNFGVSYPSLFDPAGRSLLGLRSVPRNVVPATIVLDRNHPGRRGVPSRSPRHRPPPGRRAHRRRAHTPGMNP